MTPIVFLIFGCINDDDHSQGTNKDSDGDGVIDALDCDPQSSYVGELTWYKDADGDGYGNDNNFVVACEAPEASYVSTLDDMWIGSYGHSSYKGKVFLLPGVGLE